MQGRYDEASPLLARALVIREEALGPDHPDVAHILNTQAALFFVKVMPFLSGAFLNRLPLRAFITGFFSF